MSRTTHPLMVARYRALLFLVVAGLGTACGGDVVTNQTPRCDAQLEDGEGQVDAPFDEDGDGFFNGNNPDCAATYEPDVLDCDDGDALIYPGASELCDGRDDNCDGELLGSEIDADGDGWVACEVEEDNAFSADIEGGDDCDDAADDIHPEAAELCDGIDQDCDDDFDEDPTDGATYYTDSDGDGYGSGDAQSACTPPDDTVANDDDCDDGASSIHPGAEELCDGKDNDCSGVIDESDDQDEDGYAACDDCNDGDGTIHPGATERCDGVDEDCDGSIDDGATDVQSYYTDGDGDGYGSGDAQSACTPPDDTVDNDDDCNDGASSIHPGAEELCDGKDNDCSGLIDDSDDQDGDGYAACDDCNDGDGTIHTGATERCDGVDQDCDGSIDDGATDVHSYYPDEDGDGYGAGSAQIACTPPDDTVANDDDCDDDDDSVYPDAPEVCDGGDHNCDGEVDGTDDGDGDGYPFCDDCDDGDAGVNPGEAETCDEVDQDCDGSIDEGATDKETYYSDGDGDGYGTGTAQQACTPPANTASQAGDCDDSKASIHPGAAGISCNGVDENCDGSDEGTLCPDMLTSDADATFISTFTGDDVGRTVCGAGDTDGDGYADMLIGAQLHYNSSTASYGAVYLVRGKSNFRSDDEITLDPGTDHSDAEVLRYDGSSKTQYVGGELAGGGDTNGDGLADFLAGLYDSGRTGSYLIHGVDDALSSYYRGFDTSTESWWITGSGSGAGNGVAMGGNFIDPPGREGYADIALGAPYAYYQGVQAGAVEVYPGLFPNASDLEASDVFIYLYGTAGGSQLGNELAFVGDVNGDGCDDLLAGAPASSKTASGYGSTFLVYGPCLEDDPIDVVLDDASPTSGYVAFAIGSGGHSSRMGSALGTECHVGDGVAPVNADERPDLLIADYTESSAASDAGAVFLVYGETLTGVSRITIPSTNSAVPVIAFRGESKNDYAGQSVACAGDVDGNGYDDILIGAPGWADTEGSSARGSAYLLYAASDGSGIGGLVQGERSLGDADVVIRGSGSDRSFGYSVAGVGDVNGDGYDDILIGATNIQGSGFGGAYLYYGGPQ